MTYRYFVSFTDTASTVLVTVTALLVLALLFGAMGLLYWVYSRRQLVKHAMPYSVHPARNQLDDDPHIEKSNNENEERLWRYNNSLKNTHVMSTNIDLPEPAPCGVMGSDPGKLASLGLCPTPHITRHHPPTEGDVLDPNERIIPAAIRKVQNTDVDRNIMCPQTSSKSVQKNMNLNGLPVSEKFYQSNEVIV